MRERGILFSGPMVRAILEGRKTQTRRVVRGAQNTDIERWYQDDGYRQFWFPLRPNGLHERFVCPYGQPGDRLWVRETWRTEELESTRGRGAPGSGVGVIYAAGGHGINFNIPDWRDLGSRSVWRPSIHMPRWACRLTRDLTSVGVERLCDISEADAIEEGFESRDAYLGGDYVKQFDPKRWAWVLGFPRYEP